MSFSIVGREEEGSRAGSWRACIDVKRFEAYGSVGVGVGVVKGWTFR